MTIREAIDRVDGLKYNTCTNAEKIMWLSQLDWDVKKNILDRYTNSGQWGYWGYDEDTDIETQLLIPAPWDQMYLHWLEAQIDYYNGETERYNVAVLRFQDIYNDFAAYYGRNHMPLAAARRFLF